MHVYPAHNLVSSTLYHILGIQKPLRNNVLRAAEGHYNNGSQSCLLLIENIFRENVEACDLSGRPNLLSSWSAVWFLNPLSQIVPSTYFLTDTYRGSNPRHFDFKTAGEL